jgi:hypothetical protein
MIIIELTPLKNGAHRNQTTSGVFPVPNGWAAIPEDMEIPETFPFVGVEAQDGIVTALTPGTVPEPQPEPEPIPTVDARVSKLENENKLLKEQVSAQADQAEFYENCIAEMAEIVYA